MSIEKVKQNSTLWGVVKNQLQKAQSDGAEVTNKQIVDALKAIANKNGYGDDFDQYAKDNFKVGNSIDIPGLCIEHGEVKIVEDKNPASNKVNSEVTADEVSAEDSESIAKQNTTMGAMTTLTAKGFAKSVELMARDINPKTAMKRQLKNAKGRVLKAKAQNVRNTAAGKIREARNAKANFEAEQKKLKELKQQQIEAKKKLTAAQNQAKKSPMDKAKRAAQDNAQKEFDKINKQIEKQNKALSKAKVEKTTTQKAASSAKRKVTKAINKAAGRTTKKAATKAATKTTAKAVGKAAGKTALKKIPFVGLIAGVAFAADRAIHGDYAGAAMEVASGAASCIPGAGTAASVGIDVALAAKDLHDAKVI